MHASMALALALAACGSRRAPDKTELHVAPPADAGPPVDAPPEDAAQLDPDGDDDPADS